MANISNEKSIATSSISGSNTGDETQASILAKIGYTPVNPSTLSSSSGAGSVGYKLNNTNSALSNVNNKLSESVSVKDFGAVGNGTTDDTNAVKNALQYGADNNILVRVPAGKYLITSQMSITVGNKSYVSALAVIGDGELVSLFITPVSNKSGVLKITTTDNKSNIYLANFGFGSSIDQTVTYSSSDSLTIPNGDALYITSTVSPLTSGSGFGARGIHGAVLKNIYVGANASNTAEANLFGSWTRGIALDYIWFPIIEDCYVAGLQNTYNGKGFAVGNTLTIPNSLLGGTGSGIVLTVDSIFGNSNFRQTGGISKTSITNAGTGYVDGTYVDVLASATSGTGTDARYAVIIKNGSISLLFDCENISGARTKLGVNKAGIELNGCFSPYVDKCKVQGYFDRGIVHHGVQTSGNSEQGGSFSNCMSVNTGIAYSIEHSNLTQPVPPNPGFQLINCHGNGHEFSVYVDMECMLYLSNNYCYVPLVSKSILALPDGNSVKTAFKTSLNNLPSTGIYASGYFFNYVSDVEANSGVYGRGYIIGSTNSFTNISTGVNFSSNVAEGVSFKGAINCGGIGVYNASTNNIVVDAMFTGDTTDYATQIPIYDTTGKLLTETNNYDKNIAAGEKRLISQTSATGNVFLPKLSIVTQQGDYSTNSSSKLGAMYFYGYNSVKVDTTAGLVSCSWLTNTNNNESASVQVWARTNGTMALCGTFNGKDKQLSLPSGYSLNIGGIAGWYANTGTPEGTISATIGSICVNTSGSSGTSAYIKESGTGNTGWNPIRSSKLIVKTKTVSYTILLTDDVILVAGASTTLTLPDATKYNGILLIKCTGNNAVTISPSLSQTIDASSSSKSLASATSIQFVSDGANWFTI